MEELLALMTARRFFAKGTARSIRLSAGLSLSEVARTLGVDPSTVGRWEMARRSPRAPHAMNYIDLLIKLQRQMDDQ